MFKNCKNLDKINIENLNINDLNDIEYMFQGCKNLKEFDFFFQFRKCNFF